MIPHNTFIIPSKSDRKHLPTKEGNVFSLVIISRILPRFHSSIHLFLMNSNRIPYSKEREFDIHQKYSIDSTGNGTIDTKGRGILVFSYYKLLVKCFIHVTDLWVKESFILISSLVFGCALLLSPKNFYGLFQLLWIKRHGKIFLHGVLDDIFCAWINMNIILTLIILFVM